MANLVYRHWSDDLDPDLCVSVDGDAPGRLHLSHWPGNRTPARFRHDLSTGMCLLLAQAKDRQQLLEGITTVTNNHWDTDGACSVFAAINPRIALAHGSLLVAAAAAGDFGVMTTPEGLKLDLTLTALTRRHESPVASERFQDELERRQAQYEFMLKLMPALLANPDLHADWFAREYWTIQQDLRALREDEVEMEKLDALDLAVVVADRPLHPTAVNTVAGTSRVLTTIVGEDGQYRHELRQTTLSWFDLPSRPNIPRQDWSDLAKFLNDKESGDGEWRADDVNLPTPRLAFLDAKGRLAANPVRPDRMKALVCAFFSQSPFLPAGI